MNNRVNVEFKMVTIFMNLLVVICGCDTNQSGREVSENRLLYFAEPMSRYVIKIRASPPFNDLKSSYSTGTDSILLDFREYQMVKHFKDKGRIFATHFFTNNQHMITKVELYGFNMKKFKKADSNLDYYKELDSLVFDTKIPLFSSKHLGRLDHLEEISIIMPNKDGYYLDTLVLPEYLWNIKKWRFRNFGFKSLVIPKKSSIKFISFYPESYAYEGNTPIQSLNEIDLDGLDSLITIHSGYSNLKHFSLSNLMSLEEVSFKNAREVTLKNLPLLSILELESKGIEKLTIKNCESIESINLKNNLLNSIIISNCPRLKEIYIEGNTYLNVKELEREYPAINFYYTPAF